MATWSAPSSAGDLEVVAYELFVDDAPAVVLDAAATSHRLAGVVPGTGVLVQVRALGPDGPGRTAETSSERVYRFAAVRSRGAAEVQAAVATAPVPTPTATPVPTVSPTPAAPTAPTAEPAPTVTVTAEPAPAVTTEVVREVSTDPDWVTLYREVEDSVVQVLTAQCFANDQHTGSAFFVRPDLLAATAAHVVDLSASLQVDVDGRLVDAEVVGIDDREDVALLRIGAAFPGRELAFAGEVPPVGTEHVLVGFAAAGSGSRLGRSLQVGTVSAIVPTYVGDRPIVLTDAVQSDVQSAGGASGGPHMTADGAVFGVHSGKGGDPDIRVAANGPAASARIARWSEEATRVTFC